MKKVLCIAITIGACMVLPLLTGCAPGEEMGTIVFTSNRNGNTEIYSMRADGKRQKRLTKNECSDEAPWWSPDRSRIVFTSNRSGNWDIFVMNADGTSPVQLTNAEKDDTFPCWSPDGKKIAFQSNREGHFALYTMNTDGTEQHEIKILQEAPASKGDRKKGKARPSDQKGKKYDYTHPVWFPDSTTLDYTKESGDGANLWKTGLEGKQPLQLTRNTRTNMCPSVSPDGHRILFSSNEGEQFQIYTLDEEGKTMTLINMLFAGPDFTDPRWSPRGDCIVFVSNGSGKKQIYRKRLISGADIKSLQKKLDRERQLTGGRADNFQPCW